MTEVPKPRTTGPGPGESPTTDPATEELLERLRVATRGVYEVYAEVGRGGMATVFLGHEISLDRKVAIKVMSPAMVYGPGMVERFKREARTAANLSHPNIIPVYSVRESDGLLFFVMKLVEGTPLDAIMRELGKLPLPMVEAILGQVAGAFGYAHRHGVVHRDIKPSNILIDDEGWAVVTDFGIAKVQESEGLTQSGVAVGTPTYMSPEQCSGGVITGASDQYSLGVVAYEMLAGRPPFTGTQMMALLYSHFNEPPPPLEGLRPDCPEPIRAAVMRMLEKEPAARWPSLEEAVGAIGMRQMSHDDPTRSQLISLARTGAPHRIISQVQTPRSPVPISRASAGVIPAAAAPATPAAAAPKSRVGVLLAGAAFLAAAAALVQVLRPSGELPSSVATPVAAPPAAPPPAAPPPVVPPAAGNAGAGGPVIPKPQNTPDIRPRIPAAAPKRAEAESTAAPPPRVEAPPPVTTPPPPAPPPPAPPPPAPASTVVTPPPAPPPAAVVDEKAEVTAVIQSYARALGASDLAQARRLYPGMPPDQRQGLEALWRSGGTMQPRWTVSDVVVDGEVATARVVGVNAVRTPREGGSELRVALRARLERRGSEWRLVLLVN